jgi:hypothetical protein
MTTFTESLDQIQPNTTEQIAKSKLNSDLSQSERQSASKYALKIGLQIRAVAISMLLFTGFLAHALNF